MAEKHASGSKQVKGEEIAKSLGGKSGSQGHAPKERTPEQSVSERSKNNG